MKKLFLLAFALPSLAFAQPAADNAAALRDAALADDTVAWDIVEGLTTEVGQRHGRDRGRGARRGTGRCAG